MFDIRCMYAKVVVVVVVVGSLMCMFYNLFVRSIAVLLSVIPINVNKISLIDPHEKTQFTLTVYLHQKR